MRAEGRRRKLAGLVVVSLVLAGCRAAEAQALFRSSVARVEDGRVLVSGFRIIGSTAFPPEELAALLADAEGKALTLQEIEALAGRITAYYRTRGYILARAYVPPQDLREGILEIAVLEGRVGRIEVRGAKRYDADLISSYVDPGGETPVFNADRHERGLLLLNDLPGLQVTSTLVPGSEVGTTDIVLSVERERLLSGSLEANNHGSRFTGRERFGLSLNLNSPLGIGDELTLRALVSREVEDLWLARLSYSLPVGTRGTRVGAAYTHVEAEVGREFRDLGIVGAGDIGSLSLTHPFRRSRALSFYGHLGFDYKDFSTDILGERVTQDRLRVLTIGGTLNTADGWRGVTQLSPTLHQGIGSFLGGLRSDEDPKASRAGAGGTFTKLTAEASRLQRVTAPTSLLLKAGGQWASTPLVEPEQFAVGGVGTVRGYPIGEISGDHGYAATAEFRWNAPGFSNVPAFWGRTWGELLQLFGFVDHGGVTVIDPLPGEERRRSLTGVGLGFRVGIPDNFQLKVEYARPIGRAPSDRRDNVIYFLAVKWF